MNFVEQYFFYFLFCLLMQYCQVKGRRNKRKKREYRFLEGIF